MLRALCAVCRIGSFKQISLVQNRINRYAQWSWWVSEERTSSKNVQRKCSCLARLWRWIENAFKFFTKNTVQSASSTLELLVHFNVWFSRLLWRLKVSFPEWTLNAPNDLRSQNSVFVEHFEKLMAHVKIASDRKLPAFCKYEHIQMQNATVSHQFLSIYLFIVVFSFLFNFSTSWTIASRLQWNWARKKYDNVKVATINLLSFNNIFHLLLVDAHSINKSCSLRPLCYAMCTCVIRTNWNE